MASAGIPIIAVTDGMIISDRPNKLGGTVLWLRSDNGDEYYHAYNARNAVRAGDRVTVGQTIAYVGNTGNAVGTPPHLHWEYHPQGGPAVNPYPLAAASCRTQRTGP